MIIIITMSQKPLLTNPDIQIPKEFRSKHLNTCPSNMNQSKSIEEIINSGISEYEQSIRKNRDSRMRKSMSIFEDNNYNSSKDSYSKTITKFNNCDIYVGQESPTNKNIYTQIPSITSSINFFTISKNLLKQSIPVIQLKSQIFWFSFWTFFYLSFFKNIQLTTAFGLINSMYMFLVYIFFEINSRITAKLISKYSKTGQSFKKRLAFNRGLLLNFFIVMISGLIIWTSDLILMGIGVDKEIAQLCHDASLYLIPVVCLEAYNNMLKTYLISHNVYKPFLMYNGFDLVITPILLYILIILSGLNIYGAIIYRAASESIQYLWILHTKKVFDKSEDNPQEEDQEEMTQVKISENFSENLKPFVKLAIFWYGLYFSLELNTIIIALLQNTNALACWLCILNIKIFLFTITLSLANSTKRLMKMTIVFDTHKFTKKYAYWIVSLSLFLAIIITVLLVFLRRYLACLYTGLPEHKSLLVDMIFWQGFVTIIEQPIFIIFSILTIIKTQSLWKYILVIETILLMNISSIVGLYEYKFGVESLMIIELIAYSILAVPYIVVLFVYDWNSNELEHKYIREYFDNEDEDIYLKSWVSISYAYYIDKEREQLIPVIPCNRLLDIIPQADKSPINTCSPFILIDTVSNRSFCYFEGGIEDNRFSFYEHGNQGENQVDNVNNEAEEFGRNDSVFKRIDYVNVEENMNSESFSSNSK